MHRLLHAKGFVYLTEADAERIAEYLGLSARAFAKRYCYRTRRQLRLRVPREAQCHFLRDGGCSIHAVKPTQCRIFPFLAGAGEGKMRHWVGLTA